MIDFKALASKYKTPLYVYDFNNITKRYKELKGAFDGKKSLVAYAVKSNSNLAVIKQLATLGAGADCVSIGEVKRALLAGVDKYKIIFTGGLSHLFKKTIGAKVKIDRELTIKGLLKVIHLLKQK